VDADLSGSNSAVSGWWEEGENTGGRVRHGFEKLFIGFLTARVKRWNLGITQSQYVWHTAAVSGTGNMIRRARRCIASRL